MKFWEAMKVVDEGGKVRRVSWVDCGFVQEVEDGDTYAVMWLVGMDGILYDPQQSDLRAIDWIEVDSESDEPNGQDPDGTTDLGLEPTDDDDWDIWREVGDDMIEDTDYLEEEE